MAYNGARPYTVPMGGSGDTTVTGVLSSASSAAFVGSPVTQYLPLIGGSGNTIVSPIFVANASFASSGAGADPSFLLMSKTGLALYFLATQSATSSTNINFSLAAFSQYKTVRFVINNVYPATNGATFRAVYSSNNGSTMVVTNYRAGVTYSTYNSTTVLTSSSTSNIPLSSPMTNNTANPPFCCWFDIHFPNSFATTGAGSASWTTSGGNYSIGQNQLIQNTAINTNYIRFEMSSGAIAQGNFTAWGMLE